MGKYIPQLTEQLNEALQIEAASHISLTMDIWTDRRTHAYLGMTAHTSVNFVPDTYLLAFDSFTGSHTGIRISQKVEHVLSRHNLKSKVSVIVCDNASNMKKAIEVLADVKAEETPDQANNQTVGQNPDLVDDDTLWEDITVENQAEVDAICCYIAVTVLLKRCKAC